MNIHGKIKISNKFSNRSIDQTQFEFENRGHIAFGTLQWTDVKKKKGEKDQFCNIYKRFVCFEPEIIDFIEANLGKMLLISGRLKGEKAQDKKTNELRTYEQIIIEDARFPDPNPHSVAKSDNYIDDEIPF